MIFILLLFLLWKIRKLRFIASKLYFLKCGWFGCVLGFYLYNIFLNGLEFVNIIYVLSELAYNFYFAIQLPLMCCYFELSAVEVKSLIQ